MADLAGVVLAAALAQNPAFERLLGLDPALTASNRWPHTSALAVAVGVTLTTFAAADYLSARYLLLPLGAPYLRTVLAVLLLALALLPAAVGLARRGLSSSGLYTAAVLLGLGHISQPLPESFLTALLGGCGVALGYALALVLCASLLQRIEQDAVPPLLRGLPIVLLTAALASLAFTGFAGLE